ncbi:hypothetical protein SAMN05428964_101658 [Thalassospira xiamenensis]|uniref:Uncharacterized protein n=1 Tax=Thalassospira xiamenensis TaxID=220697 RepID=A0A285RG40_9PROT|nr:hypothetical protein SAMN05428964_101658 [Thalassospira xiamenensis]
MAGITRQANFEQPIRCGDAAPNEIRTDATAKYSTQPQTGRPATEKARTHLGLSQAPPADSFRVTALSCPPSTGHDPMLLDAGTVASSVASSGKSSTATSGAAGRLATLDKPRASTSNQTPQSLAAYSCPFRQPHDHEARTNLKPPPSSPADDPQTPSASLPAPTTCANGMTTEARTNLGPLATSPTDARRTPQRLATRSGHGDNLLPRRSDTPRAAASPANRWSTDGSKARCPLRALPGHGGNLPPRRPDTPRAAAIFTSRRFSGALPPTCPPPTGHNLMPPLLPLLPLPANSGSVPRQDAPLPS